jgi:tripartite-type tricarboxylate transporter receptor subunit TctC
MHPQRLLFSTAASAVLALAAGGPALAQTSQTYPAFPIKIIVGYAAGGGTDIVARAMAPFLAKALGQAVIVDNKPGAGGAAGANFVAKARPDGYTVLLSSASSVTISPAISSKIGYTQKDFVPVSQISIAPLIIAVNKELGVHSVRELVQVAKAAPGKFNYASSGQGSGPHLAGVLFNQVAGTQMVHVPFRSGAPAVLSVMANDTQVTFATTPTVLESIRAGKLVGLAVTTHDKSPDMPDLPGTVEAGLPKYEIFQWNGVFVPAGTPPGIVKKLFDATVSAMNQPEVKKALASDGTQAFVSKSPEDFQAFLKKDNVFWQKLVKDSGSNLD